MTESKFDWKDNVSFDEMKEIMSEIEKYRTDEKKRIKAMSQIYGIDIVLDSNLPPEHWQIRCGIKFYETLRKISILSKT